MPCGSARGLRVPDWLRQRAEITPERLAVLSQDQTWTFADLDRRVDAAAAVLRDLGIRAGQRVGLLAPNSALLASDGYIVPIQPQYLAIGGLASLIEAANMAQQSGLGRTAQLVGILLTQRAWTSPNPPDVCLDFWSSAYQAIDD